MARPNVRAGQGLIPFGSGLPAGAPALALAGQLASVHVLPTSQPGLGVAESSLQTAADPPLISFRTELALEGGPGRGGLSERRRSGNLHPPPQHIWAKWTPEMCRPKLGYTRLWNPNTYKRESWVGVTPQVQSIIFLLWERVPLNSATGGTHISLHLYCSQNCAW